MLSRPGNFTPLMPTYLNGKVAKGEIPAPAAAKAIEAFQARPTLRSN